MCCARVKEAEEYEEEMDEEEELEEEMLEEVCIEPQLVLCISRSSASVSFVVFIFRRHHNIVIFLMQ